MTKSLKSGCLLRQPDFLCTTKACFLNKLLLAALTSVCMTPLSAIAASQVATDSSCFNSGASSITYGFDVQTQRAETQLDVTATFQLIEATKALQIGIVAFYNGAQVDTLGEQATLSCGQDVQFNFSINTEGAENAVLHVFPRWFPIVPDEIRRSDPTHPFPNREAYVYGTRIADVNTTVLGEKLYSQVEADSESFRTVANQLQTGHLFTRSKDEPTYIEYLDAEQKSLDFSLFFGETEDKQLIYTITCLLDDTQFPAFQGKVIWSAAIPNGQAALIDAKVNSLQTGWHKIQCYVLNGAVRGAEKRISEYPHQIYPLFLYVP